MIYHVERVEERWELSACLSAPAGGAAPPALRAGRQPVGEVGSASELLQLWRSPWVQGREPVGAVCLLVFPPKAKGS